MSLISKEYITVACNTDGFNSLLASVVNKICEISGLRIINKITHGSEEFENYPVYNTPDTTFKISSIFTKDTHMSDIYILGENEDNYCLFVHIYNGYLLFGLGHSLTYGERFATLALEKYPNFVKHCPLSYILRYNKGIDNYRYYGNYCIGIPLIKSGEDELNLSFAYYKGDNSQGIKFIVDTVESEWILFSQDDLNNRYCLFSLYENSTFSNFQIRGTSTNSMNYFEDSILVVKFGEEIPLYEDMINCIPNSNNVAASLTKADDNSYNCPYIWCKWYPMNSSYNDYMHYLNLMARTNTINYSNRFYSNSNTSNDFLLDSLSVVSYSSPLNSVHNLPKLEQGQAYLRKLYAPDSNKKINFYLWYSPVTEKPANNSFYEIAGDVYLLSTPGCIGYAIKV